MFMVLSARRGFLHACIFYFLVSIMHEKIQAGWHADLAEIVWIQFYVEPARQKWRPLCCYLCWSLQCRQWRSKLGNWGGPNIHIFVFFLINLFWNQLFLRSVNTNIWILPPLPQLSSLLRHWMSRLIWRLRTWTAYVIAYYFCHI
jgi:hypothetical protein